MSKLEHRVVVSALAFFLVLMVTFAWVLNALKVDFNSMSYKAEVSYAADTNRDLGDSGDEMYFKRLEMQQADFWALRLASKLPWFGRLFVSCIFCTFTYALALHFLRTLVNLVQEIDRCKRKRNQKNRKN